VIKLVKYRDIFLPYHFLTALEVQWVSGSLLLGEVDKYEAPFTRKVKNGWTFIVIPPYFLMA
jgi:hypothetical protein